MDEQKEMNHMRELVELLNRARRSYEQENTEIMSNYEYDKLYDELQELEEKLGTRMANSPTANVGYEVLSELPKERHERPMLSLDKTKDVERLKEFLGGQKALISWKLDGLTVVLTYQNGEIVKAVTRGNGVIGEVITNNARTFKNLPLNISYTGELILRGEAVITYSDFEKINGEIADAEAKYKNPRNLCSGSVRQLNNEITAKRNVRFYAFTLVKADDVDFHDSKEAQFAFLQEQGFAVVEHVAVTEENILSVIEDFEHKIEHYDIPSDGLVLTYESISYGQSLGRTAKFPRDSIAFKWADELRETTLKEIEWSASRTGLINPVAIFEPVELEGTTVSRASVHNISILRSLRLGIGDHITVYKANMIIPQISENLTKSGTLEIPDTCPACGGKTEIREDNQAQTLVCPNPACPAKAIKLFTHFVSRNAMNIDGLSEATLQKFLDCGFIEELYDIYRIDRYETEIVKLEGFGQKSYDNMMESIEASRTTQLARVLYGLGILNVGTAMAKSICKYFKDDVEAIIHADAAQFAEIEKIGDVIAEGIVAYFADPNNIRVLREILKEVTLVVEENTAPQDLEGKTFVITGSLNHFANRDELKKLIEDRGGKVAGSVSSKTTYLINNDVLSSSSKNKKAKSLGIPIISEDDFLQL